MWMNQAEYCYRAGKLVLMNYDCEQSVTCAIVYWSDSCQQCDVMGMTTAWINFVTIVRTVMRSLSVLTPNQNNKYLSPEFKLPSLHHKVLWVKYLTLNILFKWAKILRNIWLSSSCQKNKTNLISYKISRFCFFHQFRFLSIRTELTYITSIHIHSYRHCENFWAFTRLRIDFGLILLISNMIIHRSFTGPSHLLSANVQGTVSFAVSVLSTYRDSHYHDQIKWPHNSLIFVMGMPLPGRTPL